ncbi:MAG: D-alanyl-D-alanine carboxypeptidase [Peptococcaceae bacterium]|nr:D-alanyl-D-alanine carboxypeptidase [Peptococcaceae bacterium]
MWKTKTVILLIVLMLYATSMVGAVSIVATRGIVVARGREEPLFGHRVDLRHPPASLTKVLTVVLAIEQGDLDSEVIMSQRAMAVGGSSLNAAAGDRFTLRELLYAAMLISANDACNAIAEHLAGNLEAFNEKMNRRAAELNMRNSQFKNAHGMPGVGHYSTARDLALLGIHASSLPSFMEIAGTERFVMNSGRVLLNQNRLLGEYRGALGGKTGYTDEAGQCLLLIAERDGLLLVSVVLGSEGRSLWSDSQALLDFGFANFARQVLVNSRQALGLFRVPLAGEVLIVATSELSRVIRISELRKAVPEITLQLRRNLWPPLRPGQKVGEAVVTADGGEIGRVGLTVPAYIPLFTTGRLLAVFGGFLLMLGAIKGRRRWKG